ncbi:hypothetical protein SDC9_199416 [bioreactor metagenome]|uniref:Uncharacterized protein n=1 Tax=bioreactor metagenome TaxID=1076179 RepID=A0A645IKH1_9ZZZZ
MKTPAVDGSARGLHRVLAALERVDLAVVRNHSKRLRAIPGGKGVGRIARMHERDAGDEVLVQQVGIEIRHLPCLHHALVNQRPLGKTRHVEFDALLLQRALDAFSQHKQPNVRGEFGFLPG